MDYTSKLIKAISDFFTQYGFERTYWVGYSGGLDSCVLLACCAYLRQTLPVKLKAIYINHGLSPNANIWAAHCQVMCDHWGVEFQQVAVHLDLAAGSLEEVARDARYQVFSNLMAADDMLLTGHHQDDQAETVLLQLCRGAGLKGLSAMPSLKCFAKGYHGRPLLSYPRAELEAYAKENNLSWIEDESNADSAYSRNFIRNEILPLLKQHWAGATKSIARSAAHCAEAEQLLDGMALQLLQQASGSKPNTLSVNYMLKLPFDQKRLVLRAWIAKHEHLMPDTKKLHELCTSMLVAADDRFPLVSWADVQVRRYQGDLYLMQALALSDVFMNKTWDFKNDLILNSQQALTATIELGGLTQDIQSVQVRFRRGGEVIKLLGRGTHTLKNLFQEWRVPPWERDRVPLLFVGDKLIAVVGFAIDHDYSANSELGWLVNRVFM